jgi:hypothetical protein
MGLTVRQSRFAYAFVRLGVGKTAAIEAGYGFKNAESTASELLKNPEVSQAITTLRERVAAKAEAKAEDVIRSLVRTLHADPRLLVDDKGNRIPLQELDEDLALAIVGVDFGEGGSVKYRFDSKTKAAELLARTLGMLRDKLDLTSGGKTWAELVLASKRKAARE